MIDGHKVSIKTINNFLNLTRTKTAKQTGILYSSQILAMALGLIIAPIVTRILGPEKYGIFAFILAIITFISLFFEFGFFSAGARLLAISKNKKKDRELIGTLTLITIGISLSFFFTLFIFSFFVDSIFHTQAGNILRSISILAAIIPFQYMLQQICQGANEIKKMAIANVAPKLWYLAGLLIVISFFKLNVFIILVLSLTGIIVAVGVIIWSLKPRFNNLKKNFKAIWKETKEYGRHVYFGRVASMATYDSDRLLISYFANTTSVGFYSLAMALTNPMFLLPSSLSIILFKGFAQKKRIPKKVIYFIFLWLLGWCLGLVLVGKYIVVLLFSQRFIKVTPILMILAFANFFRGMTQPYNKFLGAKGQGKFLRNTAIVLTICNLAGNLTLIPLWGAIGAASASLFALIANYFIHIHYYRTHIVFSSIK